MPKTEAVPLMGEDGRWYVGAHSFDTNSAAWHWLDKQNGEARSRAEDVSDWVFKQMANRQ